MNRKKMIPIQSPVKHLRRSFCSKYLSLLAVNYYSKSLQRTCLTVI